MERHAIITSHKIKTVTNLSTAIERHAEEITFTQMD